MEERTNRFSRGRQPAFDVARGLAVLCMMFEHFVPTEGDDVLWQKSIALLARLADGKSAPLFCMLVGIGASLQAQGTANPITLRAGVLRRGLALGILGLGLGATFWPTEILAPIAIMTVLLWPIPNRRSALLFISIILLIIPFVSATFADYIEKDWLADGSHLHETQFGWVTLRYFIIDGNYPLMPWYAFPLIGVVFATIDWNEGRRVKYCFWLTLTAAVVFQLYAAWAEIHQETLASELVSTWVPTSIPFVMVGASSALAVISGLVWWQLAGGVLPQVFNPLRLLGRASLTHYILHICLVYTLLSRFYPEEDWPVSVGLLTFVAYVIVALPLTSWWFSRFSRGPLEKALQAASGKRYLE